jgi:hypothetical protein
MTIKMFIVEFDGCTCIAIRLLMCPGIVMALDVVIILGVDTVGALELEL